MSDGFCIYNGTVPNLVPFLSNGGFSCPTNYNPADYSKYRTYLFDFFFYFSFSNRNRPRPKDEYCRLQGPGE